MNTNMKKPKASMIEAEQKKHVTNSYKMIA